MSSFNELGKNMPKIPESEEPETAKWKVEVFTGIRPTGDLTVANYLGAVAPILKLQHQGQRPLVFVADLHAMTDKEPELVMQFTNNVVADYIALGLDPEETDIFVQSAIASQILQLTFYLMRHITVAELMRVPTLKDKLKKGKGAETANVSLMMYPVIMAADILIQRAKEVPVGEDQAPHVEVARKLARRFNDRYGEILYVPRVQQQKETLRIQSLKGEGKMSKTNPEGAIFLTDSPRVIAKKIKKAQTAFVGQMSSSLESHVVLAKGLTQKPKDRVRIDKIIAAHMRSEQVMGEFKDMFTDIMQEFVAAFQVKRARVISNPAYLQSVLERGAKRAEANANETLLAVYDAMTRGGENK